MRRASSRFWALYTIGGDAYSRVMASEFDASEFVDDDLQSARKGGPSASTAVAAANAKRAPSREEIDARVNEMQQKLADLKRAQQELDRERAVLEETRRRQAEFTTGREEMLHHLTRGLEILEKAEFAARRDAEQMARALQEFRESLSRIQEIRDDTWTKENLSLELSRASAIVDNARMAWNAALLKFPVLSSASQTQPGQETALPGSVQNLFQQQNYAELCKLGLALTWPLALTALAIFLALLLGR